MIERCHDADAHDFGRYGAKGVSVCQEWRDSFPVFFSWATSRGYRFGLQIDRIRDHDGYSPTNCRWATRSQNQINKAAMSASGFKGVRIGRYGRYVAEIKVDGVHRHIGTFDTPEDAARAYDRAAIEHFGEFARLNFPAETANA